MPEVKQGESEKDYVSRCIPYLIKKEGLTQEQAAGKCYGIYRNKAKKSICKSLITNCVKWLNLRKCANTENNGALIPQNLAGMKKKKIK